MSSENNSWVAFVFKLSYQASHHPDDPHQSLILTTLHYLTDSTDPLRKQTSAAVTILIIQGFCNGRDRNTTIRAATYADAEKSRICKLVNVWSKVARWNLFCNKIVSFSWQHYTTCMLPNKTRQFQGVKASTSLAPRNSFLLPKRWDEGTGQSNASRKQSPWKMTVAGGFYSSGVFAERFSDGFNGNGWMRVKTSELQNANALFTCNNVKCLVFDKAKQFYALGHIIDHIF